MNFPLPGSYLLLIRSSHSFVLAGRSGRRFPLCIESLDGEVCTTIDTGDVIAVSAPEGGELEPAIMLLELVRTYGHPLFVLPRQHPGSRRLRYVVSAGPEICLSCRIERGTHPEQHLLCGSAELSGIVIRGGPDGVSVEGFPEGAVATLFSPGPGLPGTDVS
jgi:hypothetical protein